MAVTAASNGGGADAATINIRMSALIDRLSLHVLANGTFDPFEFKQLCISLSRGVDFYVANCEVYSRAQELPLLLKQICESNKSIPLLQPPLMVLMFSVKNACHNRWFSDKSSEELIDLTNEISRNFGNLPNLSTEPSHTHPVLSVIISRFYPHIKIGHMLTLLEAKPGYDAYLGDFQISRTWKVSPGEKARLFVVQKDNIETSSCLITPPKVNFLLNGKGVENRTTFFVNTGPQTPTVITQHLKYGSNLLQAVGEFDGNYAVAVAFTTEVEVAKPGMNALQDYEHASATVDSDSDIVEGSSRISLNCPISLRRITIPVKGRLCKHIQCFDFDNYVDINSRRPSWRCPCCNQHICFTDICIDKKMDKVLKEVGPEARDVVFSSDGSWNAAAAINDAVQKTDKKSSEEDALLECVRSPNTIMDFMDLTEIDDVMDAITDHETADGKLHPTQTLLVNSSVANPNTSGDVESRGQMSRVSISTPSYIASPSDSCNGQFTTLMPQRGMYPPYMLMQHPGSNPYLHATFGPFPSIHSPIMGTSVLPLQAPSNVQEHRSGNSRNTSIQYDLPTASLTSSVAPVVNTIPPNPHYTQQNSYFPLYVYPGAQVLQQHIGLQASNQVPSTSSQQVLQQHFGLQASNLVRSTSSQQVINRMMHPPPSPSILQFDRRYPHLASAQMSADPSRTASAPPVHMNAQSTTIESHDPADQNWRPAGRMRGALSGQAYIDAMNQYIIRPNQQAQPAQNSRDGQGSAAPHFARGVPSPPNRPHVP